MKALNVFDYHPIRPFERYGLTGAFWDVNSLTIYNTWIVIGVIILLVILGRIALERKESIGYYIVTAFTKGFKDLCVQTLPRFSYKHFVFVTVLFSFIFVCNAISLIPWFEEPTRDLNTTLALGLFSFLSLQWIAVRSRGLIGYIKKYFAPFFLMFPLNIIGELATIVSISFRLFGNIFGGSIVAKLWTGFISTHVLFEMLGILSGINIIVTLFFGLFEGVIQSFVFAMLSLTYLSMAIQSEETVEQ